MNASMKLMLATSMPHVKIPLEPMNALATPDSLATGYVKLYDTLYSNFKINFIIYKDETSKNVIERKYQIINFYFT